MNKQLFSQTNIDIQNSLKMLRLLVLPILVNFLSKISCQNYLINDLIAQDYDKSITPLIDQNPLTVNSSIKINSFAVNERAQTITSDMVLCLAWQDFRIQSIPYQELKLTNFSRLWTPLVYFRNALSASSINTLNRFEYVQVFPPNQTLNYCSRISVEFVCVLQLANFPFDENYCQFQLENYDITRQYMRLTMKSRPGVKGNTRLRLRNTYTGNCDPIPFNNVRRLNTWSASLEDENCAFLTVRLVRSINYYIIRYYAPTFFMVMISFTQFWMPTNAWPARIMLTATIMMSVITVSLNGYNEVPSNDVTALYWWFWFCQFFLITGMAVYALTLSWVYFIQDKKAAKAAGKVSPDGRYFGKKKWFSALGPSIGTWIKFFFGPVDHFRDPVHRNKVDYFCRLFFPVVFLLYVLLYIVSTLPIWTTKFYV